MMINMFFFVLSGSICRKIMHKYLQVNICSFPALSYIMGHVLSLNTIISGIYFCMQLVKQLHPDTNKDDTDAERKLQEVQQAYEVNPGYVLRTHDKKVAGV